MNTNVHHCWYSTGGESIDHIKNHPERDVPQVDKVLSAVISKLGWISMAWIDNVIDRCPQGSHLIDLKAK